MIRISRTRINAFANEVARTAPSSVASPPLPFRALDKPKGPGGRHSISGIRAAVFGSTGFLGRYVVHELAKIGSQVFIPYRGVEDDTRHLKVSGDLGQIVQLPYDPKNQASIDAHVNNNGRTNLVINLIGRHYETKNYTYNDTHVGVATRIAEAAAKANVRLIHVSALGADANSPSRFLRSKALGEEAVRKICPSATIIRPALMIGDEDKFFMLNAHVSKLMPIVPLTHNGAARRQPVYVEDIAKAIVHCAHFPHQTHSRTYELAGRDVFTIRQLLEQMYAHTHRPNKLVNVPVSVYNLMARAANLLPYPFWTPDGVVQEGLDIVATGACPGFEDMKMIDLQPIDDRLLAVQLRGHKSPLHWSEAKKRVYGSGEDPVVKDA